MADNSRILKDLLIRTDPALADRINADWWAQQEMVRGARVAKYRRYNVGDHDQTMTEQMKAMLRLKSTSDELNDLNVNYCSVVVDKMASRLAVDSWNTGNEQGDEWLMELMRRSKIDNLEGSIYRSSIRDGDSYIMVDTANMILTSEPAYNGHDGVTVIYGEADEVIWACKLWSVSSQALVNQEEDDYSYSEVMKAIVYQPGRLTYWRQDGALVMEKEEFWGNVGIVPVVPVVNKRDNYSSYGESEIRPALPIQDIINRMVYSTTMNAELTAFIIRYIVGFEIDPMEIMPGAVINLPLTDKSGNAITGIDDETANFLRSIQIGSLEAGDMSQFVVVLDRMVRELSQATQTPIYGAGTSNMSGEALKQLEIGLIGKCQRFQKENTDAWKQAVMVAHKIQGAFATSFGTPPAIDYVSVSWKSAEIRNLNDDLNTLVNMYKSAPNLFPNKWYRQRIGGMLGLSTDEIASIEDMVAADQEDYFEALSIGRGGSIPLV